LGGFQSKPRYALKNMAEFRNLIDCYLRATAVSLVDPVKKE